MDAADYRIAEMKDSLTQREFRMGSRMYELCSQIRAMSTALQKARAAAADVVLLVVGCC